MLPTVVPQFPSYYYYYYYKYHLDRLFTPCSVIALTLSFFLYLSNLRYSRGPFPVPSETTLCRDATSTQFLIDSRCSISAKYFSHAPAKPEPVFFLSLS